MEHKNKFNHGNKVLIEGEIHTVNQCSYAPNKRMYTYTTYESRGTFFFEHELEELSKEMYEAILKAKLSELKWKRTALESILSEVKDEIRIINGELLDLQEKEEEE